MDEETRETVRSELRELQREFLKNSAKYHKALAALLERMQTISEIIERDYKL
jgi:hypothetical protein